MVHQGRYTAEPEGEFVVFLIGMRINKPHKVRQWLRVLTAMRPMIAELREHPERGLLHAQFAFIGAARRWSSTGGASRRSSGSPAIPTISTCPPGSAGTSWSGPPATSASGTRPTGCARRSARRSTGTCPRFGLAAAFGHQPVGSTGQSAGKRIGVRAEDEPALEPYENPV
jgi:Domain of unknown function (DUF4188)